MINFRSFGLLMMLRIPYKSYLLMSSTVRLALPEGLAQCCDIFLGIRTRQCKYSWRMRICEELHYLQNKVRLENRQDYDYSNCLSTERDSSLLKINMFHLRPCQREIPFGLSSIRSNQRFEITVTFHYLLRWLKSFPSAEETLRGLVIPLSSACIF